MYSFINYIRLFLRGFTSAFDLSGGVSLPHYRTDEGLFSGFERDRAALAGDGRRIAADFRKAMSLVEVDVAVHG